MVNKLEATLISGGAGGGGGGIAEKTETFVISGTPSGDNGTITRTSKRRRGMETINSTR